MGEPKQTGKCNVLVAGKCIERVRRKVLVNYFRFWGLKFSPQNPKPKIHTHAFYTNFTINEEALLLAKFLRSERKEWKPRIANIN